MEILLRTVEKALTDEWQDDGGHTTMIDPYTGCLFQCPYCYCSNRPDWKQTLYVNQNLPQLLGREVDRLAETEDLYFGSLCDPYMQLEEKYRLTRQCLEVLKEKKNKVFITTKTDSELIFRDVDLFQKMRKPVTVLMGMVNLNQLHLGARSKNIQISNRLVNLGLEVWAFFSPMLPGLTDFSEMISALDESIPVYFDKLRRCGDTVQARALMGYISAHYPDLESVYQKILFEGAEGYGREIKVQYKDNPRFTFLY